MKKKLTDADIIKAQVKTPINLVNQILLSGGKFAPAPKEPVGEKETVIGELSPFFEKAVYTAKESVDASHEAIANANNKMVNEATKKRKLVDVAKVKENRKMVESYQKTSEFLNSLLWASIRQRLGKIADGSIGIREGFQIVQIPFSSSIGEMLSEVAECLSSLQTLHDLEEGHLCEECSGYDDCDLPTKKPRK